MNHDRNGAVRIAGYLAIILLAIIILVGSYFFAALCLWAASIIFGFKFLWSQVWTVWLFLNLLGNVIKLRYRD